MRTLGGDGAVRQDMGWKAEARRIYEARVVEDALARLAQRVDLRELPLTKEELLTLAKRARESFRNPAKRKERLTRYKSQLAMTHGTEIVQTISSALEDINNEIGYEEK
jgi:hypothetical protein